MFFKVQLQGGDRAERNDLTRNMQATKVEAGDTHVSNAWRTLKLQEITQKVMTP
jgi:hypothetical protein